jgi:carbonic anhydrase
MEGAVRDTVGLVVDQPGCLREQQKNGGTVMNNFRIALPATVLACALAGPASAQQFGYACETCPTNWGALSEEFEACRVGEEQSPIDISEPTRRRLAPVRFDYGEVALVSVDRTVNIELELEDQAGIRVRGERFETVQFHFHSLSEHFLFGEQFDLELHLVHRSADGKLLVIGRFIVPGDPLEDLEAVIAAIEAGGGFEVADFELDVFVPSRRTSYRYEGSTTTPPCTEGVQWILMAEPLELSEDQIERVQLALQGINQGFDNARPLLSRNGRPILTDGEAPPDAER